MENSSNNKNKKKTGASQHTVVCTKPAPVYLFGQIGDENDWPIYFHPLAHSSHVKCETGNIASGVAGHESTIYFHQVVFCC